MISVNKHSKHVIHSYYNLIKIHLEPPQDKITDFWRRGSVRVFLNYSTSKKYYLIHINTFICFKTYTNDILGIVYCLFYNKCLNIFTIIHVFDKKYKWTIPYRTSNWLKIHARVMNFWPLTVFGVGVCAEQNSST